MSINYRLADLIVALFFFISFSEIQGQKSPELDEIVAKHIDAIGKQRGATLENLTAIGSARFAILRSSAAFSKGRTTAGRTVLISENDRMFFGSRFDSFDYPLDEITYDAETVNVAFVNPGNRSMLGNFIVGHSYIIKEGLFGGVLRTGWFLKKPDGKSYSLKNGGRKRIDGRQTYVLNYLTKTNSALSIRLYFDAETSRHIRSEYQQVFPAPMVLDPTMSARQVQTIHTLTEDFSNFKEINGLILPHLYEVNFLIDSVSTDEYEWTYDFSEFRLNQKIDPRTFQADTKN